MPANSQSPHQNGPLNSLAINFLKQINKGTHYIEIVENIRNYLKQQKLSLSKLLEELQNKGTKQYKCLLGFCHEQIPECQDAAKAFAAYSVAAQNNFSYGYLFLAMCYENGTGVRQSFALKTIIKSGGDIVIYGDTDGLVFLSLGVQGTTYLQLLFPNQFFERIVIRGRDQTTPYKKSEDMREYTRSREIVLDFPDAVAVKIVSQNLKNAIFNPTYIDLYGWKVSSGAPVGFPPNLLIVTCTLISGQVKTDRIRCSDADIKLPQIQLAHEYQIQMVSNTLHNRLKPFDVGKKNEFGSKVTLWTDETKSRRLFFQTDYETNPNHDGPIVSIEIPNNLVFFHNLENWVYVNFDIADFKIQSKHDTNDKPIQINFQLNDKIPKNSNYMQISGIETAYPIQISGYLRATTKFKRPNAPASKPVIQNVNMKTSTSSISLSSPTSNNITPLTPHRRRGSIAEKFTTPIRRTSAHQGMITPEVTPPHRFQRQNTVEMELDGAISQVSLEQKAVINSGEYEDNCHPHKKNRFVVTHPGYEEEDDSPDLEARLTHLMNQKLSSSSKSKGKERADQHIPQF
ncbi:2508_t:CDS:2 [Ambispora gerdemannii]|uniref:2508_t:CDS:1 n=1 Tax=Ambispora gerdemannii TaxID=144530 RepID=A0A9N8W299_9GLOM|nr:2508_t:CDS:2 [Ambispora gerdemannii]